ncbi:hypothetical protein AB0M46_00145 [Dactylosporangium sp. NPDC051485]|uniref:hypothetical protein n=1 Tax=Dactylosporangium sp. NPDC051485 TaxID=3154846 RepID=UPI0034160548
MASPDTHRCARCRALLARDNAGPVCGPCGAHVAAPAEAPSRSDEFWNHPSLQGAGHTEDMGQVCRAYRYHPDNRLPDGRPVPQEWIASWLELSQAQICRIERGTSRVRTPEKLQRWARALKMPPSYTWFPTDASDVSDPGRIAGTVETDSHGEEEPVKRRSIVTLPLAVGVAATGLGVDVEQPWNRIARILAGRAPLDEQAIALLEDRTADFFRREELVPNRRLAAGLRTHIQRLTTIVADQQPPSTLRRQLLSTTGEALVLYGWIAFDLGDQPTAQRFYDLAENAARDAGDGPLHACVLAYRSYLAEARAAHPQALEQLRTAQTLINAKTSLTTGAWLAAREAEVAARLPREHASAERALTRAAGAYATARPAIERSWTSFLNPSRLGSIAITTYTRLDHPDLDATTNAVIAGLEPGDEKLHAIVLADVATAALHRRQYDNAATYATSALTATLTHDVLMGRQRLQRVQREAAQLTHVPAMRQLHELLATSLH